MSAEPVCCYCGKGEPDEELRNYGPKGAPICFDCMTAKPEREAEATRQFSKQLDAASSAGNGVVILGGRHGPVPLGKRGRS